MAHIAFIIAPQTGHLNATFKLARELRSSGHNVYYVGLSDVQDYVRENGFDFIPLSVSLFPEPLPQAPILSFWGKTRAMLSSYFGNGGAKTFRRLIDDLIEKTEKQTDLFVVDSLIAFASLAAYKIGVPCILISTSFPLTNDYSVPPVLTPIIPDNSLRSKVEMYFAWGKMLSYKYYATMRSRLLNQFSIDREAKKLAFEFGVPGYLDQIKELVLCPEDLEFPHNGKAGRHYVETCIDLERKAVYFPWEKVNSDKPLVYCSIGTQGNRYDLSVIRQFTQTVISAFMVRQDLQLILSLGTVLKVSDFEPASDNILIVNKAPQLDILKRASLVITHGGLNTIKESILFGVPMIVFYIDADQPGNAARVVYHGLGRMSSIRAVSAGSLLALIDSVRSDLFISERVQRMSERFWSLEKAGVGVQIIQQLIEQRRQD